MEAEKNELIRRILDVDDVAILRRVKSMLSCEEEQTNVVAEEAAPYQTKAEILASLDQACKELKLNLFNVPEGTGAEPPTFTYSPEGVVKAKAVPITVEPNKGDFAVTLTGVGTGATEVIAKVDLEKDSVELNPEGTEIIQLKAVDKKGKLCTAVWKVTSDNQEVATVTEQPADGKITVTGVATGETELRITATCTVGGKNYTATAILPVTVKGTSGGG